MLPAEHRLRSSADFAQAIRGGRRAGRSTIVVHVVSRIAAANRVGDPGSSELIEPSPAARVGLVVGKAVGNAVVRHRVSRRLRAQMALRLDQVPTAWDVVLRALPPAGAATSAELGRDLDSALARLQRPAVSR